MKISKVRIIILLTFIATILIETISIAVYITISSEEDNIVIEQGEINLNQDEQKVLDLINEYRRENGLENLKVNSKLQEVAKLKAEDLEINEYFSHNSERLGTIFEMLKDNGIAYKIAGENLAGNISEKKAVEAWINSDSHKDNILEERFEYTGICVIESKTYGKIFVQLFIGL